MMINNATKQDAIARIGHARIGSLMQPSEEYIIALQNELRRWLKQVDLLADNSNWRSRQIVSQRTI